MLCNILQLTDDHGTHLQQSIQQTNISLYDIHSIDKLEYTLYDYVVCKHNNENIQYNNCIACIIGFNTGLIHIQYADNYTEYVSFDQIDLVHLDDDDDIDQYSRYINTDILQQSTLHDQTATIQHSNNNNANNTIDTTAVHTSIIDDSSIHLSSYSSLNVVDTEPVTHHFYNSTMQQLSNKTKQRITSEWSQLQHNLSNSVHVIVYEQRVDLLTFIIVGSQYTPYYNSIFIFDLQFTSDYPNNPPLVCYYSNNYRVNQNLYNDGKVCLSLLNTWHSNDSSTQWQANNSNILQVILSIQGSILGVVKPYFNEHNYDRLKHIDSAEQASKLYNENVLINSLNSLYILQRINHVYIQDIASIHIKHNDTQHSLKQLQQAVIALQNDSNNKIDQLHKDILHKYGIVINDNDSYKPSQGFVVSIQQTLSKLIISCHL